MLDTVYIDFSKAFDKCDHGILLHKLKKMGIQGKLGRWIHNFQHERKQKVLVNKLKSSSSILKSGVPQGSVLGPILFLFYICDIGKDLIATILIYVDDTKVKMEVNSQEDVEELQSEIQKLDKWATDNNMKFNKKKVQVMRFGQNKDLKENKTYFSGNYDEVI